uniref:Uncharacterized protein n=1 Tax=Manihot esculenta TaxID=3983 RepID=A0A2C9VGR8_MANES
MHLPDSRHNVSHHHSRETPESISVHQTSTEQINPLCMQATRAQPEERKSYMHPSEQKVRKRTYRGNSEQNRNQ